jgi:hypothetical protein
MILNPFTQLIQMFFCVSKVQPKRTLSLQLKSSIGLGLVLRQSSAPCGLEAMKRDFIHASCSPMSRARVCAKLHTPKTERIGGCETRKGGLSERTPLARTSAGSIGSIGSFGRVPAIINFGAGSRTPRVRGLSRSPMPVASPEARSSRVRRFHRVVRILKPDETSNVAREIDKAVEAWRAKKSIGSSQ